MNSKKKFAELYKKGMREARYGNEEMATYYQGRIDTIFDLEENLSMKDFLRMYNLRKKLSRRRYGDEI